MLILQITNDKANCGFLSILAMVKGYPEDYLPLFLCRYMVVHFCLNAQTFYVSFLTINNNTLFIADSNYIMTVYNYANILKYIYTVNIHFKICIYKHTVVKKSIYTLALNILVIISSCYRIITNLFLLP